MKIEISDQANVDLRKIGDWIAQENPARAISFVDELLLECLNLTSFPDRFPAYKTIDIGILRRKSYGTYLIFYVVQKDVVSISRIMHGAQDYADLF